MVECYAALKKEWEIATEADLSELQYFVIWEKQIIVTFYKKEEKIKMSIYRKDKITN